LSILNLCTVALLGAVLRSKIVFSLPFINYNHLLEAHGHFTFAGWVTPVLMTLFIYELLPESISQRLIYQWLLGSIVTCAWGMLLAFAVQGHGTISIILSLGFVVLTWLFGFIFIRDLVRTKLASCVKWLALTSILCLILSSSGVIAITYIYFINSFDAIFYRDALFTYLHFQYNGFFTLAIFAILFNLIERRMPEKEKKDIYRFSITLCVSVFPSLFLSYLWQDPNIWLRFVAITGSILLILSFFFFLICARSFRTIYKEEKPILRFLILLSMGSFMLKIILQSFTIFPVIGDAIFGNRPIIMGFLHLVFLAFVTLFILIYFMKKGILISQIKWTGIAAIVFAIAVILNEVFLISQGFAAMFINGSSIFPWLLWMTGILLFIGSLLIAIARFKTVRWF
jgi:hypothetical protein